MRYRNSRRRVSKHSKKIQINKIVRVINQCTRNPFIDKRKRYTPQRYRKPIRRGGYKKRYINRKDRKYAVVGMEVPGGYYEGQDVRQPGTFGPNMPYDRDLEIGTPLPRPHNDEWEMPFANDNIHTPVNRHLRFDSPA